MNLRGRLFDCTDCGGAVVVELGVYFGGPLAYDHFAKCSTSSKEYSNQTEIACLVAAKRERDKSMQARTAR